MNALTLFTPPRQTRTNKSSLRPSIVPELAQVADELVPRRRRRVRRVVAHDRLQEEDIHVAPQQAHPVEPAGDAPLLRGGGRGGLAPGLVIEALAQPLREARALPPTLQYERPASSVPEGGGAQGASAQEMPV